MYVAFFLLITKKSGHDARLINEEEKQKDFLVLVDVCLLIKEKRNMIYFIEKQIHQDVLLRRQREKEEESNSKYYADVGFVPGKIGGIGASLCNFGISESSLSSESSVSFDCRRKSVAARRMAKSVR